MSFGKGFLGFVLDRGGLSARWVVGGLDFFGFWVLGVCLVNRNRPRSWGVMWEGAGFWGLLGFMGRM